MINSYDADVSPWVDACTVKCVRRVQLCDEVRSLRCVQYYYNTFLMVWYSRYYGGRILHFSNFRVSETRLVDKFCTTIRRGRDRRTTSNLIGTRNISSSILFKHTIAPFFKSYDLCRRVLCTFEVFDHRCVINRVFDHRDWGVATTSEKFSGIESDSTSRTFL